MSSRNFRVSLTSGRYGSDIKQVTTFGHLYKWMTSNKAALKEGQEIRAASEQGQMDVYKAKKSKLNGFVIGEFSMRNTDSLIDYEPILCFDLDSMSKDEMDNVKRKLKKWPYAFMFWPSPSGRGLRLLVECSSNKQDHHDYYKVLAKHISQVTGLKTKSDIREALRAIDMAKPDIEKYLDDNKHIDDVTCDYTRFWYYTGVPADEFFINPDSTIFSHKQDIQVEQHSKSSNPKQYGSYLYKFTEQDKVDYLIKKIEGRNLDITYGVQDWHKLGMALYDQFGTNGEDYFHRISRYHPDYKKTETSKEWERVVRKYKPGLTSIASFYQYCKRDGLEVDYNELYQDKQHLAKASKDKQATKQISKKKKLKKVGLFNEALERKIVASLVHYPVFHASLMDTYPKFNPEVFTTPELSEIYSKIQRLHSQGENVSEIALRSRLQGYSKTEQYLVGIKEIDADNANLLQNAGIAYEAYITRKFIRLMEQKQVQAEGNDTGIGDLTENLIMELQELSDTGAAKTEKNSKQLSKEALDNYKAIKEARMNGEDLIGVPTGLKVLDNHTNGWRDGDLIIGAARPGMGKTAYILKNIVETASRQIPTGVLSLEMPSLQLTNRCLAINEEIRLKNIRDAALIGTEEQKYISGTESMENWTLHVDDKPGASIEDVERIAKKWKREHGLRILFIDYLQLMSLPKHFKSDVNNGVGYITRRLKSLAKDLKIPIVCLSQLSRAVETRGGSKRPQLSDLRDSGSIEQDADIVFFLYRAEYYGFTEDENGESLKGVAEFIISKYRNGEPKDLHCFFAKEFTKFMDDDSKYEASAITRKESGTIDEYEYDPGDAAAFLQAVEDEMKASAGNQKMPRTNDDTDIPF